MPTMDINVLIIQHVKQYPQLYQRNFSASGPTIKSERETIWKSLANTLQLEEQFVKSRWYILREMYTKALQNDGMPRSHLKYAQELEFLRKHILLRAVCNEVISENIFGKFVKPEFVITEADIEWKAEHDETEEIFFITMEDETIQEQHMEIVEQADDIPFEELEDEEEDEQQIQTEAITRNEMEITLPDIETDSEPFSITANAKNVLDQQGPKNVIVEKIATNQKEVVKAKIAVKPDIELKSKELMSGNIEESVHRLQSDVQYGRVEQSSSQKRRSSKDQNSSNEQINCIEEISSKEWCSSNEENSSEKKLNIQLTERSSNKQDESHVNPGNQNNSDYKDDGNQQTSIQRENYKELECKKQPTNGSEQSVSETQKITESEPLRNSRCEDAIFGELVAAMLKTMEPNHKKTIKKEIMNLLLS